MLLVLQLVVVPAHCGFSAGVAGEWCRDRPRVGRFSHADAAQAEAPTEPHLRARKEMTWEFAECAYDVTKFGGEWLRGRVPNLGAQCSAQPVKQHPTPTPKILFDLQEGAPLLLEAYGSKKKVSY